MNQSKPQGFTPRNRRFMSRSRYNVLICLAQYINENGYSPSIRELADKLGKRGHSCIYSHIEGLSRDGLVDRCPGRARSMQLTIDARRILPKAYRAA